MSGLEIKHDDTKIWAKYVQRKFDDDNDNKAIPYIASSKLRRSKMKLESTVRRINVTK